MRRIQATEVTDLGRDTSRAELSPAARRDLDRAATWLATNGQPRVLVEGHADQRGDARPNQALAERRASSIRDYLVTRGVDDDRIITVTYAVQRPVCQEPLETCWAQNRRAVVRMTREAKSFFAHVVASH